MGSDVTGQNDILVREEDNVETVMAVYLWVACQRRWHVAGQEQNVEILTVAQLLVVCWWRWDVVGQERNVDSENLENKHQNWKREEGGKNSQLNRVNLKYLSDHNFKHMAVNVSVYIEFQE